MSTNEPRWRVQVVEETSIGFLHIQSYTAVRRALDVEGFFTPEQALRHIIAKFGSTLPTRTVILLERWGPTKGGGTG